jgi:hypothetical protein
MWSGPPELLGKARTILADRSANADQLGIALINIHSALEQYFRDSLARNSRMPLEARVSLSRSREIDWPRLLELMSTYGGLSATHGNTIRRMNMIRNGIAHRGETYRGSRQELVRYADLAESLITGRERSFAGAEIPSELYDASMATLGVGSPTQQRPAGSTARPEPARPTATGPARTQRRPAPAPSRSRAAAAPARRAAPARGGPTSFTIAPGTIVLVVLLVIVLILLFRSFAGGGSSTPPTPTPTLGTPWLVMLFS